MPGNSTYTYAYGRTDQNGLPLLDTLTNPNGTSYLTHDDRGTPLAIKTYQGTTSYYVLDGLGSPIALVNGLGTLQATYSYDPWGNVTINNPTNSTAATLQPYRFAGGMLDRSTNYVKFGMRYYDPATGRFTQQDSVEVIGDPTRGNRYEYADDGPANYLDPTGMSVGDCIAGGFLTVGGAGTLEGVSLGAEGAAELTGAAAGLAIAGTLGFAVVGFGLLVGAVALASSC